LLTGHNKDVEVLLGNIDADNVARMCHPPIPSLLVRAHGPCNCSGLGRREGDHAHPRSRDPGGKSVSPPRAGGCANNRPPAAAITEIPDTRGSFNRHGVWRGPLTRRASAPTSPRKRGEVKRLATVSIITTWASPGT